MNVNNAYFLFTLYRPNDVIPLADDTEEVLLTNGCIPRGALCCFSSCVPEPVHTLVWLLFYDAYQIEVVPRRQTENVNEARVYWWSMGYLSTLIAREDRSKPILWAMRAIIWIGLHRFTNAGNVFHAGSVAWLGKISALRIKGWPYRSSRITQRCY